MRRQPNNSLELRKTGRSALSCCAQAALALLLALATQGIADASCGDYVFVRNASGQLVRASELAARKGMPLSHAAEPLRKPCQGPACSQRPDLPPATPPAPIVWPSSPEGLLAALVGESPRPAGDSARPASAPAHPIHHPGRVFRPPRSHAPA
jgi:hypothetical protein